MNNLNRPMLNLDLDLLRTFVAVADLDTFATAAAVVSRTQSAVSQQMQRLEQLIGKELFTRHGRNKFLTEHGIQLLGYARKILRFNDEACISLIYSNLQGSLTIGVSDDAAGTILPFLLNRVTAIYPKVVIDVRVKRNDFIVDMLNDKEVDLMLTASNPGNLPHKVIRKSPTLWYCAANYMFQNAEPIPLVILDDVNTLPDVAIKHLNATGISWRPSYVASTLAGVKTAVKEGLGITAGPVEMMSADLRVIGMAEGLPTLPDTQYSLCRRQENDTELTLAVFNAMESNPGYHISSMISEQNELQQAVG